jgi:hypothetical protein
MNIEVEPKARRRISGWAFVGPALGSSIIGYFAVGPVSLVAAAAVFAAVILLAWAGPRVNGHVYGGRPSPTSVLTASAIFDHVAGRLEMESAILTWKPRRQGSRHSVMAIPISSLANITLQPLPGIPTSCRLVCETIGGDSVELTVFGRCDDLAQALKRS